MLPGEMWNHGARLSTAFDLCWTGLDPMNTKVNENVICMQMIFESWLDLIAARGGVKAIQNAYESRGLEFLIFCWEISIKIQTK